MAKAKATESKSIDVTRLKMGSLPVHIVGSNMLMHRFAWKAWQELLLPSPKMNRAERADNLKHNPINEFRESLYLNRNPKEPTLFHVPSNAFSQAMAAAALDIPGATKAQISRLVNVSDQINLYGVPTLNMSMVRQSDMARTPDVRTRPLFKEWACSFRVDYVETLIKAPTVYNLLLAAGVIVGVGDWRAQKGGSMGSFRLVEEDDPEFQRIIKTQGRKAQQAAFDKPVPSDSEAEQLMAWFEAELERRGKEINTDHPGLVAAPPAVAIARRAANGKGVNH